MTAGQALYNFFSGFGVDAYAATATPSDVTFPYLTYETPVSYLNGGEVNTTVNLWFYTESEALPNAKAKEISDAVGLGGVMLPCDGGAIWVKRGSPWLQSLTDNDNKNIKRRYFNFSLEYLTL